MTKKKRSNCIIDLQLEQLCQSHIAQGHFTHVFASGGYLFDKVPKIQYEFYPDERQIFDLASLTKALVTTPLVFDLAAKYKLNFEDHFGDWLRVKGCTSPLPQSILDLKIKDLLSHCSGLPAWRNFWINLPNFELSMKKQQRLQFIENVISRNSWNNISPKKYTYSDIGFILLGYLIEKIDEFELDRLFLHFCEEQIQFYPRTQHFGYSNHIDKNKSIPTAYCKLRGRLLQGEVHDENCAALGGVAGHAGLFSTGVELVSYIKKFATSDIGLDVIRSNAQLRTTQGGGLLGWDRGTGNASKNFANGMSIGHLGFTGTAFWIDPEHLRYAILLTNRVISGRSASWMAEFRSDAMSILNISI